MRYKYKMSSKLKNKKIWKKYLIKLKSWEMKTK